jgi:hypothetical protein
VRGGDQVVEGRVKVRIDDLLVGVSVVPVHGVAHAGGEGRAADELRDQGLDLAEGASRLGDGVDASAGQGLGPLEADVSGADDQRGLGVQVVQRERERQTTMTQEERSIRGAVAWRLAAVDEMITGVAHGILEEIPPWRSCSRTVDTSASTRPRVD